MSSAATRDAVLAQVADHLVTAHPATVVRVGVDGITAAGKTTFARELTAAVAARGRSAVYLSTNDFHHPAAYRRRDPDPALGYYRDAFDLAGFRRLVLDPLGPGGSRRYRTRAHDLITDTAIDEPPLLADPDAVVVVDGTFLQCQDLAAGWDEVVWLDTTFAAAIERAVTRDSGQFGGAEATRAAYARRYHAACRLYLAEHAPSQHATIVVDNDDPSAPTLQRIGGPAASTDELSS